MFWVVACLVILVIVYFLFIKKAPVTHVDPKGKCVLVTGAGSGIGKATTLQLLRAGCFVYAADFNSSALEQTFKDYAPQIMCIGVDVTKQEDVDRMADRINAAGKGLYAVVNCAGIIFARGHNPNIVKCGAELDIDIDVEPVIDVNVLGLMRVTKAVFPLIFASKGAIINMGSMAGRFPVAGLIPYSISKFGVVSFTAGLRRELSKYGIRVVAIEPGFIQTPMIANMVKAVEGSRLDHSKTLLKDADYVDAHGWGNLKFGSLTTAEMVAEGIEQSVFQIPPPAPHYIIDSPYKKFVFYTVSSLPWAWQDAILAYSAKAEARK